jgi:hypothetical protein
MSKRDPFPVLAPEEMRPVPRPPHPALYEFDGFSPPSPRSDARPGPWATRTSDSKQCLARFRPWPASHLVGKLAAPPCPPEGDSQSSLRGTALLGRRQMRPRGSCATRTRSAEPPTPLRVRLYLGLTSGLQPGAANVRYNTGKRSGRAQSAQFARSVLTLGPEKTTRSRTQWHTRSACMIPPSGISSPTQTDGDGPTDSHRSLLR